MTDKYSVAILDDHPLILSALRDLIRKIINVESVLTFTDMDEMKAHVDANYVSLAIIDLRINGRDSGYDMAKHIISRENNDTAVLIYTSHSDYYHIADCLSLGVNAYISKDSPITEIRTAIEQIRKGQFYNSPDIQNIIIKNIKPRLEKTKSKDGSKVNSYLTPRELEILTLICSGYTEKEISEKLFKSVSTVHKHRQNIMEKLNCNKVHYLYKYAYTKGLISF